VALRINIVSLCVALRLCTRYEGLYTGDQKKDTYAHHTGAAMTRVTAMSAALRTAVGALWTHHPASVPTRQPLNPVACGEPGNGADASSPAAAAGTAERSSAPPVVVIAVGTLKSSKIEAVRAAVADLLKVDVACVEARGSTVESGVPGQPVGEQTFIGARNRLSGAREQHGADAGLFVAIENGLLSCGTPSSTSWKDVAVIMVGDRVGNTCVATSVGVPVPFDGHDMDACVLGGGVQAPCSGHDGWL